MIRLVIIVMVFVAYGVLSFCGTDINGRPYSDSLCKERQQESESREARSTRPNEAVFEKRKLWLVGDCGCCGRWDLFYGPMPCDPAEYHVFDSSPDALRFIQKNEGSWNLMPVEVLHETEYSNIKTSSVTVKCEWPREFKKRKP